MAYNSVGNVHCPAHFGVCMQESRRDGYIKNVKQKITKFSNCLGEKQWFAGGQVSNSLAVKLASYWKLFWHPVKR